MKNILIGEKYNTMMPFKRLNIYGFYVGILYEKNKLLRGVSVEWNETDNTWDVVWRADSCFFVIVSHKKLSKAKLYALWLFQQVGTNCPKHKDHPKMKDHKDLETFWYE